MSSSYGADVAIGRQPWSELRYKASHGSHPPTVGRSLSGALERAPPLQWVLRSRRQWLSQERHAFFPGGRVYRRHREEQYAPGQLIGDRVHVLSEQSPNVFRARHRMNDKAYQQCTHEMDLELKRRDHTKVSTPTTHSPEKV